MEASSNQSDASVSGEGLLRKMSRSGIHSSIFVFPLSTVARGTQDNLKTSKTL